MSKTYIPVALRNLVKERANYRCEYCLFPESAALVAYHVDHIVAEKHGGLTKADNLANACALCNARKGSDLTSIDPFTKEIVPLYHPRQDKWTSHFRLSGAEFVPLTPVGRVTLQLLQLNSPTKIVERQILIAAGLFNIEI